MLSGRSILVVEDEMLLLRGIEILLEDLGCTTIRAAATVAGALSLLDNQSFDIAMLDINLDGENSYPVADALLAAGIPFVFSTGNDGHGDRRDLTGTPVLKKPYSTHALTVQLGQLLDSSRK